MLKYNYAYDENGNIINIADVPEEGHLKRVFFCIGCGNQMVAAIGSKRRYFRHKADETNCSNESYLHKLAKIVIKQKFDDKSKPFKIQLRGDYVCNRKAQCKFFSDQFCTTNSLHPSIDLQEWYDSCEEEKEIDKYRADLLLSHSEKNDRDPVLIEVKYKHKCTEEKTNSKYRIIEVWINSEEDIEWLKENTWVELSTWEFDYSRKKKTDSEYKNNTPIKFFNFKPTAIEKNTDKYSELRGKYIQRFILYPSMKHFIKSDLHCTESNKEYNKYSILELNIPQYTSSLCLAHYLKRVMNIEFRACALCRHHWVDRYDFNHCNFQNQYQELSNICNRYELKWLKNIPEEYLLKDEDVEIIKKTF